MKTYQMTLNETEANTIGFCLMNMKRQLLKARLVQTDFEVEMIAKIEAVYNNLDTCPEMQPQAH